MIGTICRRAASRSTEHHLGAFYLWEGAEFVSEEHTAVLELAAVFVRNCQDFPVQLLDEQADHKKGIGIFLRHDEEYRRLLIAEDFRIDLGVEAQQLFSLAVQEGVESRQRRTHDAGHRLFGGIQCGAREPLGLVIAGQELHKLLKLILPLLGR